MAKSISEALPRGAVIRPRKPRTWWRWTIRLLIVIILVGGLGVALVGFQKFKEQMIGGFIAKMAPPPPPVAAVAAKLETVPRYLEGIGTLTGAKQVTIAPEVAGRVTEIMFEPGASVKAGDPLVQIFDAPDRADLSNFQAQQRLAEINLGRARTLAEKEFGSKQALDQAQMALDQAKAGIARTSAVIGQKQIKAPFAGQLGIRQINLGQYLNPGTAVDADRSRRPLRRFHAAGAGERSDRARPGDRGHDRRLSRQDLRRQAHDDRAADRSADPRHQDRGDHPQRRPPASPRHVRASARRAAAAAQCRDGAGNRGHFSAYGSSVYIIKEDGANDKGEPKYKAVQSFVTIGDRRNGRVSIEKGLAAGDLVATSGQLKLLNGAPVRLATSGGLQQPAQPPRE